jgi:hypothetical protein
MKDWGLLVVITFLGIAAIAYFGIPEFDDGPCSYIERPCSYILDDDGNQMAVGEDGEPIYANSEDILRNSTLIVPAVRD